MKNYNYCFLFGTGNCGLDLLISLLDNHEEVIIFPFTLKLYEIFSENSYNFKNDELLHFLYKKTKIKYLLNGKRYLEFPNNHFFRDYSKFDKNIFTTELKKSFSKDNNFSRKELIEKISICYGASIGKNEKKIKYIIIDATYKNFLNKINYDFDKFKSIFLLRDPRETFLSMLKYNYNQNNTLYIPFGKNKIFESVNNLEENYNLFDELIKKKNENYTIKFEHLSANKKLVMQDVSNFLNINFNDTLLNCTNFGVPIFAQSSFSEKLIQNESKDRTSRIEEVLSPLQFYQINFIFYKYIKKFNYHTIMIKINFFLKFLIYIYPFKYEILPSKYIFKREIRIKSSLKLFIFFIKIMKYGYYLINNTIRYFFNRFINFNYLNFYKFKK